MTGPRVSGPRESGPRQVRPGVRRSAQVHPRYGRIVVAASALVATGVAVLGSVGAIPVTDDAAVASGSTSAKLGTSLKAADDAGTDVGGPAETPAPDAGEQGSGSQGEAGEGSPPGLPQVGQSKIDEILRNDRALSRRQDEEALPKKSGEGRRAVFSESRQRVWIVGGNDRVRTTYPVSGSIYDNLDPGTYEVYSRSEDAVGIDDSGTMKYFVRFTQGDNGSAIGFHDIPVKDGRRIQGFDELGTALSHGCIRQKRSDAIRMWRFADIGTTVVVTA